jgi:hypothetical protein
VPPRRSRFGGQPPRPPERPAVELPRPPRKQWEQLSTGHRQRLLSYYRRNYGYDEATVATEYNRGTLGPLSAARGHAQTPERRIEREQATPEQLQRYPEYFRRVPVIAYDANRQTQLFYEYRGNLPKADADRAWAHYFLIRDFIEGRQWRGQYPGINPAFALQRWSVAPIDERLVLTRQGRVYELSFDVDQIEQLANAGVLDPYEISQQTGSDIVEDDQELAA